MYRAYSLWRLCLLLWTLSPFSLSVIFTNLLVGLHFWGLKLDVEAVVYCRADPLCILWFFGRSLQYNFYDVELLRLFEHLALNLYLSGLQLEYWHFSPIWRIYLGICTVVLSMYSGFWWDSERLSLFHSFLVISYASVIVLSVIKFYCHEIRTSFLEASTKYLYVILKFINYPLMLIVATQIHFFSNFGDY